MFKKPQALIADLAQTLGVSELPVDDSGGIELSVGEDSTVVLFAEDENTVMMVSPVMALPQALNYGQIAWLLRRNFYVSPLAPFRVACDPKGNLVIWGRVPIDGMAGDTMAGLVDAVASEADLIRAEIGNA